MSRYEGNNKAHLRPNDYDKNGDIIPMACKEDKGDLISRSALKKTFENACIYGLPLNELYGAILKIINSAPTVEPNEVYMTGEDYNLYMEGYKSGLSDGRKDAERPKGEWKVYGKQGGIPITDYCTNCKYEMMWYKNKYNFCPNCGADMRNNYNDSK